MQTAVIVSIAIETMAALLMRRIAGVYSLSRLHDRSCTTARGDDDALMVARADITRLVATTFDLRLLIFLPSRSPFLRSPALDGVKAPAYNMSAHDGIAYFCFIC